MKLPALLLLVFALALLPSLLPAQSTGTVRLVGTPCRSYNMLAARLVEHPQSGREVLALTNMNEAGGELIFVDWEQDKGSLVRMPAGEGSWALAEVPGKRLVIGTFFDGTFLVYDLQKEEWAGKVPVPGETYIWSVAQGKDGRIYGGTYDEGKLTALDLENYSVEDLGAAAPPNMYLRNVSALPDGRILCSYGTESPTTLVFDPATKSFTPPPPAMQGVKSGVVWNGYFVSGARLFDGTTLEEVKPLPFSPPPDAKSWSVNADATTSETLYVTANRRLYRYLPGSPEPVLVSDADLGRVHVTGVAKNGTLVGRRGQDYFVVRPGDTRPQLRRIPVESAPRPSLFLRLDERGHLWGGPFFGQTLFEMNPSTGETTNTGVVTGHGGEVYDIASHEGKIYAVTYSGGEVIEYDPRAAWNEFAGINPRNLVKLAPRGYIRPAAGVTLGPDGLLYAGWWAEYGRYGGALSITNPRTGETELIENPLGRQSVGGLAVDERCAYLATTVMANGLPNKKEAPRFGVYDLGTRQLVYEHTFSSWDEKTTTQSVPLALDRKSGRLALSADGALHVFDTSSRRFLKGFAPDAPPVGTFAVAAPGNGKAYYGSARRVVELDLASGAWRELASLPNNIWTLCASAEGTVYAACGAEIYEVKP